MSYIIRKTDGSIVATVTDGTVDKVSTSITLLGKNYKGIGEIYNTNLVSLLENFSNTSPPSNQIKGQLWFNSNTSKLNVYDGSNWRPVGSPFVSGTRPANLVQGDLWIDSVSQQLKFYDGINLLTAGPMYTAAQGKSGWVVESILDTTGNGRVVAFLYVNNVRMGVLSAVTFAPQLPIAGFTDTVNTDIKAGLSFSSAVANNKINAPVEVATALVDSSNTSVTLNSEKFLRSDRSNSTTGSLSVANDSGITFGVYENFKISVDTGTTLLSNQFANSKLSIRTYGTGFQNSIEIDPTTKTVAVYPDDTGVGGTPTLDVNGNVIVSGSLTVAGATTFTNSSTLQVTDKNIELAVVDTPTNTTANGAGITVLGGTNNNKTITWLATNVLPSAWEINDNVRLVAGKSFNINTNEVLNTTTLGSSVVASSLTSVGNLTSLTAAKFNFASNVLSVTADNLYITVPVDKIVALSNKVRIANVQEPTFDDDVATKTYVDKKKTSINYVTIDITGLSDPDVDARGALEALVPINSVNIDDELRVMCLIYTNTSLPNTQPAVTRLVKVFAARSITVGPSTITTWVHQYNLPV